MGYENYFVEEIYKNKITDPIEILNWYRNLYYTENSNTERGIMAVAINALFMKNKKELIKCEDCKHFDQKTSVGGFCKCSEIWGSRPRMRVNDDFCSYGELKSVTNIEDMKICYNCKHWVGGGDWGLSCKKDYYNCSTNGFDGGCKDFERRNN